MPQIPWLIVGFGFAVGLVIGSFLNVVIHRVPNGLSIVKPRSRCPRCENPIASYDNIPVLSWLILRGRCRHCQLAISARYPAVEFGTGLAFAVIVAVHGVSPMTLVFWVFAAMMIAVAGIDWDEQWIPDSLSLGGLALGLSVVPAVQGLIHGSYSEALLSSFVGAVLGGGLLWAVGFVHARVSVWTGREFAHWPGEGEAIPRPSSLDYWVWFPGLGFGDVKLMAMAGAFLGPVGVLQVIFLAAILGLVLGVALLFVCRGASTPFGFGPAIAAAALVAVVLPLPFPG